MIKLGLLLSILSVSSASAAPDRCGTPQLPPVKAKPSFLAAGTQRVIYLNRFGGRYAISDGETNASMNIANVLVAADQSPRTANIAPMEAGFDWAAVAACVTNHYKPFNVRVVESQPKDVPFVEAVVGGDGTELGYPLGQLFGIASADNFCSVTERGIAFSFSKTHQDVDQKDKELCATIAHEVGHLLALEHEILSTDNMSYVLVADSPSKAFVNQASNCGVAPGQENQCSCQNTNNQTNSAGRLNQFVGERPSESNPPKLTIVSPGNGNVSSYFEVLAKATDAEGMADVRVLVDDLEVGNSATLEGDAYHVEVKAADGKHTLKVIARDLAGNETSATLMVTSRAGELGDTCVANESCATNDCVTLGEDKICTQSCETDACPGGFACDATAKVCVPDDDGGGCCSVGGDNGAIAALFGLGVGLTVLRKKRAR